MAPMDFVTVFEVSHVKLADGGALEPAVSSVDHHAARAADAFTAIVVESDGSSPFWMRLSFKTSSISRKDICWERLGPGSGPCDPVPSVFLSRCEV